MANLWTARTKEIHNPHVDDVDINSLLEEPEEPIAKTKVPYPEDNRSLKEILDALFRSCSK